MKKLFLAIVTFVAFTSSASAYTIGGAYASLVSCDWGQYGYEYGYIGTYEVNGSYYRLFFGSNFCPY